MADEIVKRSVDFSQWYADLVRHADLAEHSPVRGCMIIKPYGYALWERIQCVLNGMLGNIGVENVYFPMLIPRRLFSTNVNHEEGFASEFLLVTRAGGRELDESLIVRPTSEAIVCDALSRWVRSYRDLPMVVNQWANVVRWEKRFVPFLRTTEFLWQEGYSVHADAFQAQSYARMILHDIYREFAEGYLAMPVYEGKKADVERFPGAEESYCIEAMMQDGKSLQAGTAHYLGDSFAKAFNVCFVGKDGLRRHVFQTSWGVSTRLVGGIIMIHGDDRGLILPPRIAPVEIVIVLGSAGGDTDATDKVDRIVKSLSRHRIKVDRRTDLDWDSRILEWERKGIPLRLEVGQGRAAGDVCVLVRRDTGEEVVAGVGELVAIVPSTLKRIQERLFFVASERSAGSTRSVDTWREFSNSVKTGGYVLAHWCGEASCQAEIKGQTGAITRFQPFETCQQEGARRCVACGKLSPSGRRWAFARAY